jgi:hypothetical protein
MEISQGNSLYSYLKETKMSFFFNKIREQEGRTGPAWRGVVSVLLSVGGGGSEEQVWECEYSANTVYACV